MFRKPHPLVIPIKMAKINVEANYLLWSAHNPHSETWSQCTITIKHANSRPFDSYHFWYGRAFSICCICIHLDNDDDANRFLPFHSAFHSRVRPWGAFRDHIYRLILSWWSCRNPWGSEKHILTFASDTAQIPAYESQWQITHPIENPRKIYEARKKERKSHNQWYYNLAKGFK